MEEAYAIVIKVKYGDVLRRFSSWISDNGLEVNMDGLNEKIISLFKLPENSVLMLTYIDEDGDEVMLVDDDDLRDIVKQVLDPLRISVKMTAEKNGEKCPSSGSFTPLKSPLLWKPFQYGKTAPDAMCETLVNLSTNLATKASTSTPEIKELINYFSEVSSSYLAYGSESQPRVQTPTHNLVMEDSETSKADAAQSMVRSNIGPEEFVKQNESSEKLELLATAIDHAVILGGVVGMKGPPAAVPGFNALGHDSRAINASQPVSDSLQSSGLNVKSRVVQHIVGKKEKFELTSGYCLKDETSLSSSHHPSVANIGSQPDLDPANPSSKRNASASPLHPACSALTLGGNCSQNDDLYKSCHQDYFCDGCGADPIYGPRFRSKVEEDYDLCIICFSGKENYNDYIRIDRSVADHHQVFD